MDKLTIVEGEERLKTEIDFLDGQLKEALRENERLRMRLAQMASGDYKACGMFAEDVAKDALSNKESDNG